MDSDHDLSEPELRELVVLLRSQLEDAQRRAAVASACFEDAEERYQRVRGKLEHAADAARRMGRQECAEEIVARLRAMTPAKHGGSARKVMQRAQRVAQNVGQCRA